MRSRRNGLSSNLFCRQHQQPTPGRAVFDLQNLSCWDDESGVTRSKHNIFRGEHDEANAGYCLVSKRYLVVFETLPLAH